MVLKGAAQPGEPLLELRIGRAKQLSCGICAARDACLAPTTITRAVRARPTRTRRQASQRYSLTMRVPHFGHAMSMQRWPTTWGERWPHLGQTQSPPGPEPGLVPCPWPLPPPAPPRPPPPPRPPRNNLSNMSHPLISGCEASSPVASHPSPYSPAGSKPCPPSASMRALMASSRSASAAASACRAVSSDPAGGAGGA